MPQETQAVVEKVTGRKANRVSGTRMKRREDVRMITGRGTYTDDIKFPDTLYAAFLRSPYAHAKIKSVKTDAAGSVPGVVGVFTGKDLKDKMNPIPTAWHVPNADQKDTPYYAIAHDKARYVGDPVAVVVARSPYIAMDALDLIDVDYELLPAISDPEEAVKPGSLDIYEGISNNVALDWKFSGGDGSVFDNADIIVKERLKNQRLQPSAMETRSAIASYDPGKGETTVWMTSQNPHVHRFLFSSVMGIPETKLRVISPDVGGAFGSKIACYGPEVVLLYLTKHFKKPVKWTEDRRENYLSTTHGRDHVHYVELAAKNDGTILGIRVKVYSNLGGWISTVAPGVPTILSVLMYSGQYKMQAVECEVIGVLTNTMAVDAYRGAGRPEATFIVERMVDNLARKLGMDPAEIRRKNYIGKDEFPYTTAAGTGYDSGNYHEVLDKALSLIDYNKQVEENRRLRKEGKLVGTGIGSYVEMSGAGPSKAVRATGYALGLWESATVRVHPSGKVTILTGSHPHGQGEETTFAQMVSDELQIPYDDVDIVHGDTESVPFGMGTYASRTTPVGGGAIALACRKILKKATGIAAHMVGSTPDDMAYEDGYFYSPASPEKKVTLAEVGFASYSASFEHLPDGMEPGLEETSYYDPVNFVFPFGTHVCNVEIDPETYQVKINRYVAVDDCGPQLNPMIVEGQVHGGIVQGLGQALYEEAIYDESGNLITASLADYAVPTAVEVPRFETAYTETPSPHNPTGTKGVGEAGTIAATPALVNAVIDALSEYGITNIDMPLKPENIWKAVKAAKSS